MTQEFFFGDAKWIGSPAFEKPPFSIVRGRFFAAEGINELLLEEQ